MARLKNVSKVSEQLTPEQAIATSFPKPGRILPIAKCYNYTNRANTFTSASTKAKCKAYFMSTDCSLTSIAASVGVSVCKLRTWLDEEKWQIEKDSVANDNYLMILALMKDQVKREITAAHDVKMTLIQKGGDELTSCMSNVFKQLNDESKSETIDHKKMVNMARVLKDLVSVAKEFGVKLNENEGEVKQSIARFDAIDTEFSDSE